MQCEWGVSHPVAQQIFVYVRKSECAVQHRQPPPPDQYQTARYKEGKSLFQLLSSVSVIFLDGTVTLPSRCSKQAIVSIIAMDYFNQDDIHYRIISHLARLYKYLHHLGSNSILTSEVFLNKCGKWIFCAGIMLTIPIEKNQIKQNSYLLEYIITGE